MTGKTSRKGARIFYWLGILGIIGQILTGSLLTLPITTTVYLLFTLPYLYLLYKSEDRDTTA